MFLRIICIVALSAVFVAGKETVTEGSSSTGCTGVNRIPDEDKFQVANKSMIFIPYERSWTDALKMCTEMGMKLVSIESAEQQRGIEWYLHKRIWGARKTVLDYVYWNLWTSGADVDSDGQFEWKAINKPVTFAAWGEGEPNGGSGESCIELRYVAPTGERELKWNDSVCWVKKRFICEESS